MVRSILLLCAVWLGFVFGKEYSWELFGFDDRLAWAFLLPGVYVVGLAILRD